MRVIGVTQFGGPEKLEILDKGEPHAGPGEVRIAVRAVAVSPTDTLVRAGLNPRVPGPPYVPGMDAAGVVDEVGDGSPLAVGDEVMAIAVPDGPHGGAYSEYLVGDWHSMARIPAGTTLEEASTLPMNALTAVQALEKLALPAGATIAVTGAAGTLGGYVIQLAKYAGLRVIADASPRDEALVASLGADAIVIRGDDVASEILQIEPTGVDAVIDAAVQQELVVAAVRDGGAFVSFRGWPGPDGDARIRYETVAVAAEYLSHDKLDRLRGLVEEGVVTLHVAGVLPAAEAAEAHRRLEAGGTRGRFVLTF